MNPRFGALVALEARRELRSRDSLLSGALLAALLLLLDLLVLGDGATTSREAALVLWVPLLLGGGTLAARAWARDADTGAIALLRSYPVPPLWLALARLLVQALLMGILLAGHAALAQAVFGIPVSAGLLLLLALGALGLLLLGSLCGALGAQARSREALLPMLLVPLAAPILVAGARGTEVALAGGSLQEACLLLGGYAAVVAGLGVLVLPILLEGE